MYYSVLKRLKWSGKVFFGKPDHRIFGASGPEKKVLENRTTGYLERVVRKRIYGKTGPQDIWSEWSGKEGIGKPDHRIFGASGLK